MLINLEDIIYVFINKIDKNQNLKWYWNITRSNENHQSMSWRIIQLKACNQTSWYRWVRRLSWRIPPRGVYIRRKKDKERKRDIDVSICEECKMGLKIQTCVRQSRIKNHIRQRDPKRQIFYTHTSKNLIGLESVASFQEI